MFISGRKHETSYFRVWRFQILSGKYDQIMTSYLNVLSSLITPHAQRERGKVIDRGVHIYIYMSVDKKKYLNRTLEIDSPFQTLTVGLLVEFID